MRELNDLIDFFYFELELILKKSNAIIIFWSFGGLSKMVDDSNIWDSGK
jgi:hypothetical protein